jgi:arylsulfatase A-like enzyme
VAGGLGAAWLAALAACLPGAPRREIDLVALFPQARSGAETASLDLGSDASLPALVSGWGPRARAGGGGFQWGQGQGSELRFGVGEPRDLELRLRGWPLAFDGAPPQSVEVLANGHPVATLELAPGPHDYPVRIPAAALVPGENRLALRYAWARAPRDVIPGSSEARPLAVAWDSLRLADARRHGAPAAEPAAAEPALRLPLASWIDYYVRVPDGSRLRIAGLQPFGPALAPALEIAAEPAGAPEQVARFEPGRAVDLALPPARGGPTRISLRALGGAEPGAEAGLRLARPVLDAPGAEPAAPPPRAAPVSGRRPHVVLYLVDTLRADRLGAYGYPRPTSPRIDAFAREATLFRNAFAQSSWTKPAVASLFTGLLPQAHRINPRAAAVPEGLPILPEILRDAGYATFGVVTNGNVSRAFGFARGFDVFEQLREGATREIHQRSDRANQAAFALLEGRPPDRPFFLYVHTADPHWPYTPPERERARLAAEVANPGIGYALSLSAQGRPPGEVRRQVSQLYDAEIAFNDESFGRLLEKLHELRLDADTLVILLSDHGEGFDEHGSFRHGTTLFSEEIRIPLVIRFPGGVGRGRVVDAAARQVDVLPTILDVAGVPIPAGLAGRSLLPAASEAFPAPEPDGTFAYLDRRGRVVETAIEGGRKLIRFRVEGRGAPGIGLFDLASDPGETRDLAASERVWREYLLARLDAAAAAPPGPEPPSATLDAEQRRALEALGYLDE